MHYSFHIPYDWTEGNAGIVMWNIP
jgi:hypothetical protein